MLTTYMQLKTEQQTWKAANIKTFPSLTLSYDLENYYPLLAHISQDTDQRWILFIAPPGKPNFTFLKQAGVPNSRIITLPQNKVANQSELLKTALQSQNYSTIITWLTDCDIALQNELTELATQSASSCFIYCTQ